MNQEDLIRLKRLSRRPRSVWSGGWVYFPMWIDNGKQPPFRPRVPIWLNEQEGGVRIGRTDGRQEAVTVDDALTTLVEFACESSSPYLPGTIEVNDEELAAYLERELGEFEIAVRFVPVIRGVQEAEKHFAESPGGAKIRSLLSAPGIDDALLARFATFATALYEAAPWRYLGDQDYLVAEGATYPRTMGCVSVLGAAKQIEGLSFSPRRRS